MSLRDPEARRAYNREWNRLHRKPDHRNCRKRDVRAHSVSAKRTSKRDLLRLQRETRHHELLLLLDDIDTTRPKTRGDCERGERPCPFVACAHHLYLDVNPRTGSLKFNFPDLEPWELEHSCALDIADEGGLTLERIAELTNLTRERIRQIQRVALPKFTAAKELDEKRRLRVLPEVA